MRVSPPEQLRAVAACATIENHPPAVVIEENAPSEYFYLIVEGKVGIYREEKHPILESLSAGAVFGLLSIVEQASLGDARNREHSILIEFDLNHIAALRKRITYLDWSLGIVHPEQRLAMKTNASTQLATMLERDRAVTAFSSRLTLSS